MKIIGEQKVRKRVIPAAVILAGALLIIILLRITRTDRDRYQDTEFSRYRPAARFRPTITANPGGSIPTAVPTITPTPLQGMDSPVFCKLEMTLLHNKAEALGDGGMLIPDSYEQPDQTCVFAVRERDMLREIGHIRVTHKENAGYGIRVEISDNMGEPRTEQLLFWGTAALWSLDKQFTRTGSGNAIAETLDKGSASLSIYDIFREQNVLNGTTVISIIDRTRN